MADYHSTDWPVCRCGRPVCRRRSPYCASCRSRARKASSYRFRPKVCAVCEKRFIPKRLPVSCCSRECGWKFSSRNAVERRRVILSERATTKDRNRPRCATCGDVCYGTRKRFCSDRCNRSRLMAQCRPCSECDTVFIAAYRGPRHTCSDDCRRRRKRRLAKPRKGSGGKSKSLSHVQRARRIGAAVELGIRRCDIFARDGWCCQLCGRATPKRLLRDYKHPAAPTLDHIVPISQGGGHTRANLQCACRDCNSKKAGRTLGQLRIF